MHNATPYDCVTAFLVERDQIAALVREVYEGYLRTGGKSSFACEQAGADLALTPRTVQAWVSPSRRDYITPHAVNAARAGIVAGHQSWLRREADRMADRAEAMRARLPSADIAPLRSVGK